VPRKAGIVAAVGLAIVLGAGLGLLPILQLSLLGALALVLFGVLTPGEAKNAVDLEVVVVIASAFGLAAALQASGLADAMAGALAGGLGHFGPEAVLAGIVVATLVLKSVVTNNAAAALMFPLGLSAAADLGLNGRAVTVAIAIAASASFLTPIGYQTNLMVYGPAGYRFGDYARLGLPLTILVAVLVLVLVPLEWGLVR
jgi:di/tricarboxylate transporter